jgi:phosphorylase kinase alpha/beta subunit
VDEDGGYWEEINEKRSSSIASCYRGLLSVKDIVDVPDSLIAKCKESLYELFPYETPTRKYDLAQLCLIYPYKVFGDEMSEIIIKQVEDNLLRERGVIRYIGDSYYSTLEKEHGRGRSRTFYESTEAEWCFGFCFLSLAWLQLGNIEKAKYYIEKTEEVMLSDGSVPELYYAKTNKYNPNTPLCWSNAMYIQAKEAYEKRAGALK